MAINIKGRTVEIVVFHPGEKGCLLKKEKRFNTDVLSAFLKSVDDLFAARLSSRVNLTEYCRKIMTHAVIVAAFHRGRVVGLCALYLDDPAQEAGFLTLIAVLKEFQGFGLGKTLLGAGVSEARSAGKRCLRLEVNSSNYRARRLYQQFGFYPESPSTPITSAQQYMRLDIQ